MATPELHFIVEVNKYAEIVEEFSVPLKSIALRVVNRHLRKKYRLSQDDASGLIDDESVKIEEIKDDDDFDIQWERQAGHMIKREKNVLTIVLTKESLNFLSSIFSSGFRKPCDKRTEVGFAESTNSVKSKLKTMEGEGSCAPFECTIFSGDKILVATENFSQSRKLDAGGQGTVYRGTISGTEYAIKKYPATDLSSMSLELNVLSRARHPHIVNLIGVCIEHNCIVSEFVKGGTLKDRLKDKTNLLSWFERREVIDMIVQALRFLHESRIIHMDLKPDNVLLKTNLEVKLADMGIARTFDSTAHFQEGKFVTDQMFTKGYVDPSFLITGQAHHTNDIYSLGLLILQICTNLEKISDVHAILGNVKDRLLFERIEKHLSPFDDTLPKDLCFQIAATGIFCINKNPDRRPSLEVIHGFISTHKELSGILSVFDDLEDEVSQEKLYFVAEASCSDSGKELLVRRESGQYFSEVSDMSSPASILGRQENVFPRRLRSQRSSKGSQEITIEVSSLEETTKVLKLLNFSESFSHIEQKKEDPTISPSLLASKKELFRCYVKAESTEEAESLFEDLSRMRNPWTELGKKYLHGFSPCPLDYAQCYRVLKIASDRSETKSLECITALLERVCDMATKNELSSEIVNFLLESAHDGSAMAALTLGHHYKHMQLYKESLHWYSVAAKERGLSYAKAEIETVVAKVLENFERDPQSNECLNSTIEAASNGSAMAALALGHHYKRKNLFKESLSWYNVAAREGEFLGSAKKEISDITALATSKQPPETYLERLETFSDAIPLAAINRGVLYEFGIGDDRGGESKAFEMYSKAAKWSDRKTQWTMGLCYLNGRGVRQKNDFAQEWFEKAAANGDRNADWQLKMMRAEYSAPSKPLKWTVSKLLKDCASSRKSESFKAHGSKWRLILSSTGAKSKVNHLSVYLELVKLGFWHQFPVVCHCTVVLLNQGDKSKSRNLEGFAEFSSSNQFLSFQQHVPACSLMGPEFGFAMDNSLELEATLEVAPSPTPSKLALPSAIDEAERLEDFVSPELLKAQEGLMDSLSSVWHPWSELAVMYMYGLGPCPVDYEQCCRVLKIAADKNEPMAAEYVIDLTDKVCLARRTGALSEGLLNLVTESANEGGAMAALTLGHHYKRRKLHNESLLWFSAASKHEAVIVEAMEGIIDMAAEISKSAPLGEEALSLVLEGASKGSAMAALTLGHHYKHQKLPRKSLHWYDMAGKGGLIEANTEMETIIKSLLNSVGSSLDEEFVATLESCSDQVPLAAYYVGRVYLYGYLGVERVDEQRAFAMFLKGAVLGHNGAQLKAADCFLNGKGTERNKEAAMEWFEKAGHSSILTRIREKYSSPCEPFKWRIPNFSKSDGSKLESEEFATHGSKWKVKIRPKGLFKRGTHISLWLEYSHQSSVPVVAHCSFLLMNIMDGSKSRVMEVYDGLDKNGEFCFVDYHTPIMTILDGECGFLAEDVLEIHVFINVRI